MQIDEWWERSPWLVVVGAAATALIAVVAVALTVRLVVKAVRSVRGAAPNLKLAVGQALVQAGVTWAVVTGTYEFCTKVFKLPDWEAGAFAVFLEAATWVTVGMIYDHGKGKDKDGKPNVGFGPAGPFFWLFSVLGGILAVIAGATFGAMIGRAVIVVFGACLWYLALLRVTRRSGAPSRFRWTPRALLIAIGAIAPADQDVRDEHQEWQIRRMARAMRWANGRWPWSWLGQRALTGRAEQAQEVVIEAARRRYAVAHVVVSSVQPDSEVMRRIIEDVKRGPMAPVSNELRTELDEIRMDARQVTTKLRAQVDQMRTIGGIRMPAHIAAHIPDQIPADWVDRFRTSPADQAPEGDLDQPRTTVDQQVGPDQTSEVDQTPDQAGPRDEVHARTSPADQAPASGSVPAARTTTARRTTVRVDQVRPVSPAAGGPVPPRVEAMVQALREAYPGDIPGRRTVMDRMSWTSAGDAQTAINLVRAERTKTPKES
ncbi:hypothetical protein [Micromonospora sp. M71_S20]|uniref:hypothetical protein n=1 Tax=Micromonospora sp. M71_S20 TaxID=592872 RepID=UPI0011E5CCC1|nr:hypothetical protein [Micromonospora sp. M71_S20]